MNIGIQMFSKKTPRERFFFLSLSIHKLSDTLLRRGRLGAEKISRELAI